MPTTNAANKVAGISAAAVQAKTGKTWTEWCKVLDKAGARKMSHKEIATYLYDELGVPGWWCQMVAVGYEQARGLREKHQTPTGYEISVSKTLPVTAATLYGAWHDEHTRARWLPRAALTIRKATANKSMRITWGGGKTSVDVYFYPKGAEKCQVNVQHRKLPDAAAGTRMKTYWAKALQRLAAVVQR